MRLKITKTEIIRREGRRRMRETDDTVHIFNNMKEIEAHRTSLRGDGKNVVRFHYEEIDE